MILLLFLIFIWGLWVILPLSLIFNWGLWGILPWSLIVILGLGWSCLCPEMEDRWEERYKGKPDSMVRRTTIWLKSVLKPRKTCYYSASNIFHKIILTRLNCKVDLTITEQIHVIERLSTCIPYALFSWVGGGKLYASLVNVPEMLIIGK